MSASCPVGKQEIHARGRSCSSGSSLCGQSCTGAARRIHQYSGEIPTLRTRGSNADRPRRGGAGGRGPSFRANAPQSLRLAGASERITSAAQIDPLAAPRPFPSAHTPPRRPTQERATGTTPRTGAPVAGRALAARRPRVQLAGRSETRVAPRDTHTRHTHTDPFSCLRVSRLPPRSAQVGTVS